MNANYITYLRSQSRSPLTIKNYTKYIAMALDYIGKPEADITYMDLVGWKNTFTNLKPNSQNIRISAIKNYFGFLKKADVITSNPAEKLEKKKFEIVMLSRSLILKLTIFGIWSIMLVLFETRLLFFYSLLLDFVLVSLLVSRLNSIRT